MALIADDARDRAEQLLLLTERLTAIIEEDARRIEARELPLGGVDGEERERLTNAYRLELARIKQDRSLLEGAPAALLNELKANTKRLHDMLDRHEIALGAVKLVAEGLVQAMAEETARQRAGARGYGASGVVDTASVATPTVLDRKA